MRPSLARSRQFTVASKVREQPTTRKPLETRSPLRGDSTKTNELRKSVPSVFEQTPPPPPHPASAAATAAGRIQAGSFRTYVAPCRDVPAR
jgi:hypothetical protein